MFDIGTPEVVVIILVALVVLGPKKLPEVVRAVGKAIRELKRSLHAANDAISGEDERIEPKEHADAHSKTEGAREADSRKENGT